MNFIGWVRTKENTLEKSFRLRDFREALAFVNKIGKIAEKMGHHPDISIKNYNQVFISVTTHDKMNVITEKDEKLTEKIDKISGITNILL